jgi:hypothetical protein
MITDFKHCSFSNNTYSRRLVVIAVSKSFPITGGKKGKKGKAVPLQAWTGA